MCSKVDLPRRKFSTGCELLTTFLVTELSKSDWLHCRQVATPSLALVVNDN
jgi:hypothetical protein